MKLDVRLLYVEEFKKKGKGNMPYPEVGQVYRAIKREAPATGGFYQLIFDNEDEEISGMFIPKLRASTPFFDCKLREIDLEELLELSKDDEVFERVSQWGVEFKDGLDESLLNVPTMHSVNRDVFKDAIKNLVQKIEEEVTSRAEVKEILSIKDFEPEMAQAMSDLERHVLSSYDDKYEGQGILNPCKSIRYSEQHGKGANIHNTYKYIHRYMSDGYEKSNNPKDLLKAIHYLLFELTRLNINERD